MTTPLTAPSTDSIAKAIADNFCSFIGGMTLMPGAEIIRLGESTAFMTGIKFPMFNGLIDPRFSAEDADRHIDTFVNLGRERNVPIMCWTTAESTPADLDDRFKRRGFRGRPLPGMAVDLDRVSEPSIPPGVDIEVVDASNVREAANVSIVGFGFPAWLVEPFEQLLTASGFGDDAPLTSYLARLNGEAVATAALAYSAGVAGIYNVATLPEARGRGIGRAMTVVPLHAARDRGYRIGILQSSDMGLPLYRRLGFEHYCDIGVHMWTGDSPAPTD